MKYTLIFFLTWLFVWFLMGDKAFALDCTLADSEAERVTDMMEIKTDVPAWLKGATITVRLADGKETTVPAETFKVVARKQQFIVTKTKQTDTKVCMDTSKEAKKNRVSVMGGQGPNPGLERSENGSMVEVESKHGVIGGAQYQRLLTDKISVGAQVQSNESVLVNVGLDF